MVQSEQNWLSLLLDLCYMKMVYYKLFCKLCKNLPTSNRLSKYCKNVIVIKCKFFRISWRGQILFFDQVCSHSCSTDCITNKVNIFNWIFYGIRYSIQYIPCTLALDSVNGFFFLVYQLTTLHFHYITFVMTVYIFYIEAQFYFFNFCWTHY